MPAKLQSIFNKKRKNQEKIVNTANKILFVVGKRR
jgi:hypothetical protein